MILFIFYCYSLPILVLLQQLPQAAQLCQEDGILSPDHRDGIAGGVDGTTGVELGGIAPN